MLIIILVVITNIYISKKYYRNGIGIIHAPFILNMMALLTMTPMLVLIYKDPHYNYQDLVRVSVVMLLSHFLFHIGYSKEFNKSIDSNIQTDFYRERTFIILFLFIMFGFISDYIYSIPGSLEMGLWVYAGLFLSFDIAAFIILVYLLANNIEKNKNRYRLFVIMFIASIWPIYDFAINIKGSRTRLFYIALMLCYFFAQKYSTKTKLIKMGFVLVFIIGSFLGASIQDYRNSIHGGDKSFFSTDFIQNFEDSMNPKYITINGFDLGNAAKGMEYCASNSHYSYGGIFVDRLIFNYVPARFLGASQKNQLYVCPEDVKLEESFTNSVTTMTGYYEVFNCFGYLGVFLFYLMGRYMGRLYSKHRNGLKNSLAYFFCLIYLNVMISHGLTYFFSNLIFLYVLIIPIVTFMIKKRLLKYKENKIGLKTQY